MTLPLPVGLFTPVFLTGSVIGRIIGEIVCTWTGFSNFVPSDYSLLAGINIQYTVNIVIPAAAFSTGVTRAISTAVIVYELSGESHLRLPLSVVILSAYFVGNRFSKNVYEVLIDTSGNPYMQEIPKSFYNIPVSEVMVKIDEKQVLALNSTYLEAYKLLSTVETSQDIENQYIKSNMTAVIPIVQSKKSMVIVGAVLREDLELSLQRLLSLSETAESDPVVLGLSNDFDEDDIEQKNDILSIHNNSSSNNNSNDKDMQKELLEETIQFLILADGGKSVTPVACASDKHRRGRRVSWKSIPIAIVMDPSPYQIVNTMYLSKVELLFRMLSLNQAYVTKSGRLVGLITRSSLREYLSKNCKVKRPIDKCVQLAYSIYHYTCNDKSRIDYQEIIEVEPEL